MSLWEYGKLANRFTAEKFDADFITDMALAAGMKYINITTRHHDSFCLFDSKYTDFTKRQPGGITPFFMPEVFSGVVP